jgi:4-aminobutyrate aminotransferase
VLDGLATTCAAVAEVRGRGLMLGVELVEADGRTPAPVLGAAVLEAARCRGVLIGLGGLHGNCLRIAPPLSVSADEAERGARAVADAIVEVVDDAVSVRG